MLRMITHITLFCPSNPDETEGVKEKCGQHTDHEEVEGEEHKGDEDGNIRLENSEEAGGQTRGGLKEETLSFQVRGDKEDVKNDESGRPNSWEINVATGAELDSSAHGNTREGEGEKVGSAEVTGTNAGAAPLTVVEEVLSRRPDLKKHRGMKRQNQTGNEEMNILKKIFCVCKYS